MICVYCFDITDLKKSEYETLYSLASEERKCRADQYARFEDSVRCIVGEMLLRYSLQERLGTVSDVIIFYNKYQKPFLKSIENFFFNISHSGKWVVLACDSQNLGVDVEKRKSEKNIEKFAKRFFTEEEQIYIEENPDEKSKRFTEIWTCKEAYIKYLGTGLSEGLTTFSVVGKAKKIYDKYGKSTSDVELNSHWLDDEYVLSVCSGEGEFVVNELTIDEIMQRREL